MPFLLSGNNPPEPGNRQETTNNTATESHFVQGRWESLNPSSTALRPPSRSWAALSHRWERS